MLLIPAAVLVPYGIWWVLAISKSDNGIASLLLPYVVPPALIAGSASRLLELLDASSAYEYPEYLDLRRAGTLLAWTSILATLGGTALWALVPGVLHKSSEQAPQAPVTRRKFAYSASPTLTVLYGATFAVLWALILAPVWLAVQPNAQITLALTTAALVAHLELIDAARDGRGSPGELFNRSRRRPRTSTTGTADNGSWARAWDSRGGDGRGSAARALGVARVLRERTPSDSCEFAVEGGIRAY